MKKLKSKLKKWWRKDSSKVRTKAYLIYMAVWCISLHLCYYLIEDKQWAMMTFGGIMYLYGNNIESRFDKRIKELQDNGH